MHKEPETLGEILKTARMRADITMETLAERVDITERYLYRIENEGKKPSFDVLYKLIRELAIPADSIFYPEKPSKDSEIENLVRMLYGCNERSMEIIIAAALFNPVIAEVVIAFHTRQIIKAIHVFGEID